jgi:hypothetical protein
MVGIIQTSCPRLPINSRQKPNRITSAGYKNISQKLKHKKIKDIFRCPFLFRRMDLIFYIITISRVRRHKEITNNYSSKYVLGETRLFGVQFLAGG